MSTAKKTESPQEKPEKRMAPVRAAGKGAVIYIGPTIPGVVIAGTVYNNGYPEKLEKEVEKNKALSMLMVPVSELAKARQELKMSGSVLNVCYEKVKEER